MNDKKRMVPYVKLGKTHTHPHGHYGPNDKGSLVFSVGSDTDNRMVFIEFGDEVSWLALPPERAIEFARVLEHHAKRATGEIE